MALPVMPKQGPKTRQIAVRISEAGIKNMKRLTSHHNLSQSDILEDLLRDAVARLDAAKDKPVPSKRA